MIEPAPDAPAAPPDLLWSWLRRQCPAEAADWLEGELRSLRRDGGDRELFIAFAQAPARMGKRDLALSPGDRRLAAQARPGWRPERWSTDQAARVLLLLAADGDADAFARRLDRLCAAADLGELVALYRGLPLYPHPERHVARAAEGVRSNMRPVFEAVAHHNPYPAECFDEGAWNQMVLKALFIGAPLAPIHGIDARANPALARMLCDYAHERWAAGRPVSPELWRCVGPHADDAALADLERVLASGDDRERRAAALALASCPRPEARRIAAATPDLAAAGAPSWEDLA